MVPRRDISGRRSPEDGQRRPLGEGRGSAPRRQPQGPSKPSALKARGAQKRPAEGAYHPASKKKPQGASQAKANRAPSKGGNPRNQKTGNPRNANAGAQRNANAGAQRNAKPGNPRNAKAGSAARGPRSNDPRRQGVKGAPSGKGMQQGTPGRKQKAKQAAFKQPQRKPQPAAPPNRSLGDKVKHALAVAGSIAGVAVVHLWRRSKVLTSIIFLLLLLGCVSLIGSAIPTNKLYDGVHIGSVDVSGMNMDEAAAAVQAAYSRNLNASSVYIFADEETANSADIELKRIEDEAIAEQISFEEAQEDKKLWIASADSLEAYLPSYDMVQEAFDECRSLGFFPRLFGAAKGIVVEPRAYFNETLLGNLITDINGSLGTPVEDFGIELDDGDLVIVEGHNGELLNNERFASELSSKLLQDDSSLVKLIAEVEFTPYNIDYDTAEFTRSSIEAILPEQIDFLVGEEEFHIGKDSLLEWISTEPVEEGGSYFLNPFIDHKEASKDILSVVNLGDTSNAVNVRFLKDEEGQVFVKPESDVVVPNIEQAVTQLDDALFSAFRATKANEEAVVVDPIEVTTVEHPEQFTVEEAISYGVVTRFSSFTTQFTSTASTANRTFNVHHAADLIDNSIVEADGGKWSFNEIAGSCDEENGFLAAKVIEGGNYTEGVGGGVCQVATTVFNAAYEAGLPIDERYNHSLYSSSYPAGRDAAISYPEPDLIWSNPTDSDILLVTGYSSTSVTVTLIGCDPKLEVETETGEWIEGVKHTTKYEQDDKLSANASYIKTAGTDGLGITVVRTVTDSDGNFVSKDTFKSNYAPINRVIAFGPGSDMEALVKKYTEDQ